MRPLLRRHFPAALALLGTGVFGCSLIVTASPPSVRCTGSDPSACPRGLLCDTELLVCVEPPSVTIPQDGEDVLPEDRPEASADVVVPPGPSPLGGSCIVDRDCVAGLLCGSSTLLTTSIIPANTKAVCTKPCCQSSDCATGFICFPGGTGGNYCVEASKAGRKVASSKASKPGETCASSTECRSGLCTDGRCVDTCCGPDECASGSMCQIATANDHVAWVCGAQNANATLPIGASCTDNTTCKTENCVQPFSAGKRCTPTCCNENDCTALGLGSNVCAYGQAGNDHLKWCFEANANGKSTGATCSANADCASRYCDAELHACALPCCTNADCASGESCLPSPSGTPYLRCVAKP